MKGCSYVLRPTVFFLPKESVNGKDHKKKKTTSWVVLIYISYHNSKNGWYFEYRFHNVHWVLRKRLGQLTNHNSEEGGGGRGRWGLRLWIPLRYTHFDWLFYVLSKFFWEDTTADEGDIKTRVCLRVCVGGGGCVDLHHPQHTVW